jgi:hypothetical protein
MRSGRLPSFIEVDQKSTVLPIDTARRERFQHVPPEGGTGLRRDLWIHHDPPLNKRSLEVRPA